MRKLILKSNAKINLSLDVERRMGDGYHQLSMIMHSIDLGDILTFEQVDPTGPAGAGEPGVCLLCDDPDVPTDSGNLIVKAAELIYRSYRPDTSVTIRLDKRIPAAAGLGGGSSNAAATLIGLNKLLGLGMTKYEMWRYSVGLGADVPFFLEGGCALCRGIGEVLTPIDYPFGGALLLVKPIRGISTAKIYKSLPVGQDRALCCGIKRPDTEALLAHMREGAEASFYKAMGNVMMDVSNERLPLIGEIISKMESLGAKRAMMSGSGPTVFGIFEDESGAKRAGDIIAKELGEIMPPIVCGFSQRGVEEE